MEGTAAITGASPDLVPEPHAISTTLIGFSLALQVLDLVVTLLNARHGLFSFGAGPIANLLGMGPLTTWLGMKVSALVILMLGIINSRRWLLVMLDAWYSAFITLSLFVLLW